jgi:hypothetical protein
MSGLLTYVWHYMVARVLYDELVRPLVHGHLSTAPALAAVAAVAFVLGRVRRRTGRRRRGRA